MAERTTTVTLRAATSSYVQGFREAAAATNAAATAAQRVAAQGQAFDQVGKAAMKGGIVIAAGLALAVTKFAEFDQAMSQVKAATQETAENMGKLRAAALDAGAKTQYSATEAANAIEELGKAGLTTQQILSGGLNGALTLAAAGGIGVADAAQTAAIAVKQFGLEGSQVPHVADLLAAGAGKAVGDVSDLSAALNQAGLVANQTGLSIEDTTGLLAAFADKGLLGSDAGTSLKTMLQSLVPNSKQAAAAFEDLGISAFDAQGQFVGITKFAGDYSDAMHKLTPEQQAATSKIIFGSDAVRAANVLYDLGAKGIQGYIDQTNDAGYAAKVAADRTDNLAGDIERLGGSFDTALIQSGSASNDVLRDTVKTIGGLVDVFGNLPAPVLATGTVIAVVSAAMLLAGGTALTAVPKFVAFKASLLALGATGRTAALGIAAATAGLTAVTFAIGAIAETQAKAANTASTFEDSLNQTTGAITDYTRELLVKELKERSAFDDAKRAGISQSQLTDAILEGGDALDAVNQKIRDSGTFFDVGKGNLLNSTRELRLGLDEAKTGFDDTKAAADGAAGSSENIAKQFGVMQQSAEDAAADVQALTDQIANFGKATLDSRSASRAFESAVDDAAESIKDNGKTLDINTEKGRANQAALDDIAKAANENAASKYNETGSIKTTSAALEAGRDEYIKTGIRMGLTRKQAKDYADQLISTPDDVKTQVRLQGVDAAKDAIRGIFNLAASSIATIGVSILPKEAKPKVRRASGGTVYGPGTSKSDSVYMAASNGEFVVQEPYASQNKAILEAINSGSYQGNYATNQYAPSSSPAWAQTGSPSSKSIEINYTTNNPVSKDPAASAREAAQFLAAQMES